MAEAEKNIVFDVLLITNFNRKSAARKLGISYRSLLGKVRKYKITKTDINKPRESNWPSAYLKDN